ncbi:hypothetical protein PCANC_23202 [Puccinia coronata f. sp. avenae]|uniref:Uncharacterized protein n=1 Tax=Puccinia coronata f. sp. avenae TaxID=200324 RepID=A0A2N5TN24_9BASI|nr:hypothetical protein PCANC_23202 [Puccinia coronata f. sp. avenae]
MPLLSTKRHRVDEESDSDESFHCCGKPEDLALDPPTPKFQATRTYKEVCVPDNQDFYCYQSGIERQKEEREKISVRGPPEASTSASLPRRVERIHSADSDKTWVVGERLLLIKTGISPFASSRRMRAFANEIKIQKSVTKYFASSHHVFLKNFQGNGRHPDQDQSETSQKSILDVADDLQEVFEEPARH